MTQALDTFNHVFEFNGNDLRIVDKNGDPWVVAKDICKLLGIRNTSQALDFLDEDEKGIISIYTPGGYQNLRIITIDAAHGLALQSRKKEAKPLARWLRKEVLPAIRKKGFYAPGKTKLQVLADITAEMVRVEEEQTRQGALIESHDRSLEDHDTRIDSLEQYRLQKQREQKQAHHDLFDLSKQIPEKVQGKNKQPRPKTARALLNEVVRQFGIVQDIPINHVWMKVYTEFRHRYGIDIPTRAKNRGISNFLAMAAIINEDIAEYDIFEELLKVAHIVCRPSRVRSKRAMSQF